MLACKESLPTAVLLLPVVLAVKELYPTAVLLSAVETFNALTPTAVSPLPWSADNASNPTPTLFVPSTTASPADIPI